MVVRGEGLLNNPKSTRLGCGGCCCCCCCCCRRHHRSRACLPSRGGVKSRPPPQASHREAFRVGRPGRARRVVGIGIGRRRTGRFLVAGGFGRCRWRLVVLVVVESAGPGSEAAAPAGTSGHQRRGRSHERERDRRSRSHECKPRSRSDVAPRGRQLHGVRGRLHRHGRHVGGHGRADHIVLRRADHRQRLLRRRLPGGRRRDGGDRRHQEGPAGQALQEPGAADHAAARQGPAFQHRGAEALLLLAGESYHACGMNE